MLTSSWKNAVLFSMFLFASSFHMKSTGLRMLAKHQVAQRIQRWGGVVAMSVSGSPDVSALIKSITDKGNEIRTLKQIKPPTLKEDLAPLLAELTAMKLSYLQITGEEYGGGKPSTASAEKKESLKVVPAPASASTQAVQTVVYPRNKNYFEIVDNNDIEFGDFTTIASNKVSGRRFTPVSVLGTTSSSAPKVDEDIWIRGRVSSVRAKGNTCFLVIRADGFYTLQACHFKDKQFPEPSKAMIKFVEGLALESIVDIYGTVANADIKSCTQGNVEIRIRKLFVVSRAPVQLPFLIEDASRSEEEIDKSQETERPFARVGQDLRLNNRWLDLRVPANNAIMRIKGGVAHLFRESLMNQGFVEIITPKLIPGESEGGAGVFRTDYFGRTACLAQSPQLYKQMAISADLERVFEIGPVFRAENSNTRRHLCEFTGLDLEMSIFEHYNEALIVLHKTFRHIFDGLEQKYAKELAVIREQYPSEPVRFTDEPLIVHWPVAMKMLRDAGVQHGELEDLSTAVEIRLGELVKEKHGADFYILDQYPANVRPFYTMPSPADPAYSNSYDVFIRGQEICSGAQRCHEAELLEQRIKEKGIDPLPLSYYIDSFRHGVKPHAGAGVGLERVVFLYLGLDNVRKASMFPRDPGRCEP